MGVENMVRNKAVLIAGYLLLISGILHIVVCILTLGLLTISGTTLIFGISFLPLGLGMIWLVRKKLLDETRRLIIFCGTISFLNSITLFTHILRRTAEEQTIIYIFLIFFIIIDLISFPIFYIKKTELDRMDTDEKLSYFSIIIIRGLGLGLLFNVLAWIGLTNGLNYYMVSYILIFGTINMIFGQLLYNKKAEKKIQISGVFFLTLGLIFELILCFFFFNAKSIANIVLYAIVITIRTYYIFQKNYLRGSRNHE